MADKITDLPVASELNAGDAMLIAQNNESKQITGATLMSSIGGGGGTVIDYDNLSNLKTVTYQTGTNTWYPYGGTEANPTKLPCNLAIISKDDGAGGYYVKKATSDNWTSLPVVDYRADLVLKKDTYFKFTHSNTMTSATIWLIPVS